MRHYTGRALTQFSAIRTVRFGGFLAFAIVLVCGGLARSVLAAPGDLDPTFGTGGKVTTDFFGNRDQAFDVAVQADGKIVAAGTIAKANDR